MKGRYFNLRLVLIGLYLGAVGATGLWVYEGWPVEADHSLDASISAVPGALKGRLLVLVTNEGERTWDDVRIVLNREFVHTVGVLPAGGQASVSVDDFLYTYTIPRDWSSAPWGGVSPETQTRPGNEFEVVPEHVRVEARQGFAEATVSP